MTTDKGFKRQVRARARRTGESYTAARAQLRPPEPVGDGGRRPVSPAAIIVVAGPGAVGKSTVARLVAAAFDRSVHLKADDFTASVVSGWVDPASSSPEAAQQNEAIGGALAVSAMGLAGDGYTTVVDGYLFPDGVAGLAAACSLRGIACHYAVLSADLDTCRDRAEGRGSAVSGASAVSGIDLEPFAAVHERYRRLALASLDGRHVISAAGPPESVSAAVLDALRAGRLVVTGG